MTPIAGEELTDHDGHGLGDTRIVPVLVASACVGFMIDEPYFVTVRHRHNGLRVSHRAVPSDNDQ